MYTAELDYELPAELVATEPVSPRDQARLMVVERAADRVTHRRVCDLPELLRPGDLLVVNASKVLPAYLEGVRVGTGGRVTGLYLVEAADGNGDAGDGGRQWRVMLESRGTLQPGERIRFAGDLELELLARESGGAWRAAVHGEGDTPTILARAGKPPLPPYIRKARRALDLPELRAEDVERYNTVYAAEAGSVAAPTAGLHFTPELLDRLRAMGVGMASVILHVGLGTFQPIRTERVEDHPIHREWMSVPAETLEQLQATRRRGGRIVVVGTTTVRALESLPPVLPDPLRTISMETALFITPSGAGEPQVTFRYTDVLMTNFHLPRSTLLALVAALPGVGIERLRRYYRLAVAERYRFYSYGDAMLLL